MAIASAFTATISASPAAAQRPSDAALARLPRLVTSAMQKAAVPGAAVAVIREGEIVFARGFGVRRAGSSGAVGADTVFEVASLGKTVFSRLVLDLAADGALELDRPLIELVESPFVPSVPRLMASKVVADARLALITPRLVLSHRSGFPNWGRGRPLELLARPGERFSYSGEAFQYLQRVVEQRTGQSLLELSAGRLLAPLSMRRSSYAWSERFQADAAWGHDAQGRPSAWARFDDQAMAPAMAAGSLYTTVADFALFLIAALDDPRIRSPQTRLDERIAWGLGWGLEETKTGLAIWHWGDNDEFKALVFGYPASRSGVVVLTNGHRGLRVARTVVVGLFGPNHPALAFPLLDYGDGR
jgi:CubicO group peptidase (beta-lactamase class C family)